MRALARPSLLAVLILCNVGIAAAGQDVVNDQIAPKNPPPIEYAPSGPGPQLRISAGAVVRSLGDLSLSGDSNAAGFGVRQPYRVHSFRHSAGPRFATGDRRYEDGFVRTDAGTPIDGNTWFWGYRSASQVQGDVLVYHAAESETSVASSINDESPSPTSETFESAGPYLEADFLFPVSDSVKIGPQLSVMFVSGDIAAQFTDFVARFTRSTRRVGLTDRYALGGVVPPTPPYSGALAGPGPVIPNRPAARSISRGAAARDATLYFNEVEESLEADVVTVSLGAECEITRGPVYASLAAGLAASIVDFDARHDESLYRSRSGRRPAEVASWHDAASDTDIVAGAYVQAAAGIQLTESIAIEFFGRSDWSESVTGSVGPSSFSIDPSGLTAGIAARISF